MSSKPQNPSETANFLSYYTFAWFVPTILKGYKKPLSEDDLLSIIDDQRSKHLGDRLEKHWTSERDREQPSLIRAIWKTFALSMILQTIVALFVELVLKTTQAIAFMYLLQYYSYERTNERLTLRDAYVAAAILALCGFAIAIVQHVNIFNCQVIAMKIRVACCALIYRKSMKIDKFNMGRTTVGRLVNLVTNDVSRFDYAAFVFCALVIAPLEIILVTIIVWDVSGWTGVMGIAIFLICIPIQMAIGVYMAALRKMSAKITDERIKIISEVLSTIQVIKMYAWEQYFIKLVNGIRKSEIKKIRGANLMLSFLFIFINFLPKLALFACIVAMVLTGYTLTPKNIFTLVIFYNMLKLCVNVYLPQALARFGDVLVTIKRIENFLILPELEPLMYDKEKIMQPTFVELRNVTAKWNENSVENTLENLNMDIRNPTLTAIIGPVGSGKSSLMNVLIKELPISKGEINMTGTVSYCSQESWFFKGTIKENVLFGHKFNERRYKTVLKICALERDLSLFPQGDQTKIAENGANLSAGQRARINLARSVYKKAEIYLLDDPLCAVDTYVAKLIFDECISKFLKDKSVILVTNQVQFLRDVDFIYMLQNGKLSAKGTYKSLKAQRLEFFYMLEEVGEEKIVAQVRDTNDYLIRAQMDDEKEFRDIGSVSFKVYRKYLLAGGNICVQIILLLTVLLYVLSCVLSDAVLGYWSNVDSDMVEHDGTSQETYLSRSDYLIIYGTVILILFITTTATSVGCFMMLIQCSKNLHNTTFMKVIRAPMKFFHANPSGRMLNRYSKDVGLLDEYLPAVIVDALIISLLIMGMFILEIFIDYWLSGAVFVVLLFVWIASKIYLPSAVAIKRLEGLCRSPVCIHVKASFLGLSTVRAFMKQADYIEQFDYYQDDHTSAWFMYIASIHAFGCFVDILSALFITAVTFVFFVKDTTPGAAGLAISQSVMLMVAGQWCLRQCCEVVINLTSAERIAEYAELDSDGSDTKRDVEPRKSWPEYGAIEFKCANLKYDLDAEPILKNLNFKISPGQKVGVVGRTGAGKSSLLSALFQLTFTDGYILIDGVNVRDVPLEILRPNISVIPQEPILFSTTMRKNLDPFDEFTDSKIWSTLEEVEMKRIVANMPKALLTNVSEGGQNLSVGQRQLICLARTIIKSNKVLIMDEATANVDPKTDSLIQVTIRKKFKDCTVLTIAHRLHTIIDNNIVLVMDGGEVKEFDHPHLLLGRKGMFYDMVQKTGNAMSESLHQMAQAVSLADERSENHFFFALRLTIIIVLMQLAMEQFENLHKLILL